MNDTDPYRMLIDGKWVDGSTGERFDSLDPYRQKPWASIPQASDSDVDHAVRSARAAFETTWRKTNGGERARLMLRLADLIEAEAPRLARLETTDNGKVIRETTRQMGFAARNYRFLAGQADKLYGQTIPLDNADLFDFTLHEPAGVAALLVAWNSPIQLLTNKLAPALAAGCTVVIKPSEHASVTTLELARLAEEAGYPPGVINVVTGDGRVGAALTAHDDLDLISFTGGQRTGRLVARAAADNLVAVALELGGKSPNIVFADADLDAAIPGALAGIFGAAGQTCIAGSRLLVERPVYEEVLQQLGERTAAIRLGDPLDPDTEMGPVANQLQYDTILDYIAAAKADGARLLTGGGPADDPDLPTGYFVQPTVFADVTGDMKVASEEVFGPVLAVMPFDGEEEAIRIANSTQYGLASGLWTRSLSRAMRVAREIRAGTVWINTYRTNAAQAPFGGYKKSGFGRERGLDSLHDYLRVKNVMADLSEDVGDPFAMRV
ncbi:aldehyde dehydrogenase [Actinomadura syzygii]|uniref:Aldehyde dehydrogenase n=1 Tax=Actinomadura syzygii TaxID=1427538 RepID=A0A5D0UE96_9ACTN|nr:aldehyde dehydrogenase [Actinomadura syzygii]TYC15935.1 aldehyde dehydrogenase [Actinomadura syzygii]